MCGIFGMARCGSAVDRIRSAERAMLAIRHRGPDDQGIVCLPESPADGTMGVILGNVRLAILDLSPSGRMPMPGRDRKVWITYNGELYNFVELREELKAAGHSFRSTGDTEVLIKAYEEWGEAFIGRLNGMFALAIADYRGPRQKLLLARDHLGIKPCYYVWRDGELAFASELKALRAAGLLPDDIDWQAIHDYFTFLFIPGPRTAFTAARELLPAHYLVWEPGAEPRLTRYWSPQPSKEEPPRHVASMEEVVPEVRRLLHDSVRRQLVSDVPLGVFLSGGIDSTILTGLAAEETPGRLKTFTVLFEGRGISSIDDRVFARRVSERYATEHHELTVDISDPRQMLDLGAVFDEPFGNPTYYLSYLISQKTREHVTVALSGAGGDELFAGYPRYLAVPVAGALARAPRALGSLAERVADLWREDFDDPRPRRVKLLVRGIGEPFAEQYLRWTYFFSDEEKQRLLSPLRAGRPDLKPAVRLMADLLHEARELPDARTRVQYVDLMTFLPDNILEYTDKTSMAVSLEVRVPFLDHRVVELSFRVPFNYKLRLGESKRLLRQAFFDLIPREIAVAPKRGFSPPLAIWMSEVLDRYFDSELTQSRVERLGIMSWPEIQRLRAEHRTRSRDNSMKLFGIIMFDVWWRRTFERA